MSSFRRKLMSALVAAISVGGFSGSFINGVSNVACASSTDNVSSSLDGLSDGLINRVKSMGGYDRSRSITMSGSNYVIPCFGGCVEFGVDNARWIESSYGKSLGQVLDDFFSAAVAPAPTVSYAKNLKKYDNRLMYGAMSNFMPWLSSKDRDKFTDVSSVAMWVLKESESVDEKDFEKGVRCLEDFVGEKAFKSYKRRWDSCYNFGAICFVLYDLVKGFNKYCDDLKPFIDDGLPVDTSKVNVSVLSKSEDRAGFLSSLFGGKDIVYDCVVNLAEAVLELFTR